MLEETEEEGCCVEQLEVGEGGYEGETGCEGDGKDCEAVGSACWKCLGHFDGGFGLEGVCL